jgi:hypothetical protein
LEHFLLFLISKGILSKFAYLLKNQNQNSKSFH